jgi:hypothetical protein
LVPGYNDEGVSNHSSEWDKMHPGEEIETIDGSGAYQAEKGEERMDFLAKLFFAGWPKNQCISIAVSRS